MKSDAQECKRIHRKKKNKKKISPWRPLQHVSSSSWMFQCVSQGARALSAWNSCQAVQIEKTWSHRKKLKLEDGKSRVAIPPLPDDIYEPCCIVVALLCHSSSSPGHCVSHKVTQNIELVLLLSNNNQPHAIIPLLLPITFRCGGGPNTLQIQTWQIWRDTQKGGWASIWLWQECNCGIPLDPRKELQTLLNCHSPPVLLPPDNYTTNPTPSCLNSTTHLLCPEKMDLMIKHIFWRGWGNCPEP